MSNPIIDDVVLKRFQSEYDRALKMEYIRNPVAYALYQTWIHFDKHKLTESQKGQNNEKFHKAEST